MKLSYDDTSDMLTIHLYWKNDGAAPFYANWPVQLYLIGHDDKILLKAPVDITLSAVIGTDAVESVTQIPIGGLLQSSYKIGIAILDPLTGNPAVSFSMKNERSDAIYVIGSWK